MLLYSHGKKTNFRVPFPQTATAEELAAALNRALRQDALLEGSRPFLAMPYHGKLSDADRTQAQVWSSMAYTLYKHPACTLSYRCISR